MLRTIAAVFVVLLFLPSPALAHGGKIKLEVAGDGATGVTVRALYQSDGHPVEDKVLSLTLTATGEGGRAVGPLTLAQASEGRAFYSSGAVLSPGRWTVVVAGPDPNVIRAESTVEARAPQAAPVPAVTATTAAPQPSESGSGTFWSVGFFLALGLAGLAVYLVQRRSSGSERRSSARPRSTPRPRRHS